MRVVGKQKRSQQGPFSCPHPRYHVVSQGAPHRPRPIASSYTPTVCATISSTP